MVTLKTVLSAAFEQHEINKENSVVFGSGVIAGKTFHILGVEEETYLGIRECLVMSEKLIKILESKSKNPLFLLVDVAGQKLSRQDEWLAMNQYFAQILACLSCLRHQGTKLISLVYNQAIGGAFLAYGLMADTILALPQAKIAVMWLEAMSRITKISLKQLKGLSKYSPVFAPGIENFSRLGGINEVVALSALKTKLLQQAEQACTQDLRAKLAYEREGRKFAYPVIRKMLAKSCTNGIN